MWCASREGTIVQVGISTTFGEAPKYHILTTFGESPKYHIRGCSKYHILTTLGVSPKYHIRGCSKYHIRVPRRGCLRCRVCGRPRVGGNNVSYTLLKATTNMMLRAYAQRLQELHLEPSSQTPECITQVLLQARCECHAQAQWGAATSTVFQAGKQTSQSKKLRAYVHTLRGCHFT